MARVQPGSVVRFRDRLWVLLPSPREVFRLRPLTGTEDEVVEVHRELAELLGYSYPTERVEPAGFPLPQPEGIQDGAAVHLLWQAARLLLREGAAPLRSLGRISIRPRTYQLVPLLMALRLDPVRLLIADDVGVGKTIEAALIARELWDRGEIRRFAVLCPPYLCDQWAKELAEKFHFDPVVVGSATLAALERQVPPGHSVYGYFPVQVLSIDFVKREPHKLQFLRHAPELVIVDEAHGATPVGEERHQRYALVRALADDPQRHLILLTATPHSGIPEAFQKLLGLLDREFEAWAPSAWTEEQRARLARHFVQRTRADIKNVWEQGELLFPERETQDVTYTLSPEQRQLFQEVHALCLGIVQGARGLAAPRRRMRYWAALALLRAVMSSPAAAAAALRLRRPGPTEGTEDTEGWDLGQFAYEPTEAPPTDEVPTPLLSHPDAGLPLREEWPLRRLRERVRALTPARDAKLQKAIEAVKDLLRQGFHPIVWCFYVPTAEYVAAELEKALAPEFPRARVLCLTGRLGEEERRALVEDFMRQEGIQRVLVATECLAEGVNLQEGFNAVLHYDLPWNPNRLEQREGRVDRYGQPSPKVRALRFYGRDNPVDGAVIRVLLNKAREIRQSLGTYVPVPAEEEYVIDALIHALFSGPSHRLQEDLAFEFMQEYTQEFHRRWELDAQREKESRTRFAQRALRPEEVEAELRRTDAVLGDPAAVERFVREALGRLGIPVEQDRRDPKVYHLNLEEAALARVPLLQAVWPREGRGRALRPRWSVAFVSPTPEGAEYVGRNHRLVVALAQHLFEAALAGQAGPAARCGALRTSAVPLLTVLLLLRARYLLSPPADSALLAEEVLVTGFVGADEVLLPQDAALELLGRAQPVGNIPEPEKRELVEYALARVRPWLEEKDAGPLGKLLAARAGELEEAHRRLRRTLGARVRGFSVAPQWPPDVLGILVLQPLVGG
ncbi:MAG: DEAD/DEAH box helicase [Candidatus Bipolaricaulota bacterium]|nr:DEAD/DEAH box helicase [Candidatus Bipolaricaulota bacterium]MDW8152399.1 helicase-related protein [Candidatus Bipolaricaulota bacterium]